MRRCCCAPGLSIAAFAQLPADHPRASHPQASDRNRRNAHQPARGPCAARPRQAVDCEGAGACETPAPTARPPRTRDAAETPGDGRGPSARRRHQPSARDPPDDQRAKPRQVPIAHLDHLPSYVIPNVPMTACRSDISIGDGSDISIWQKGAISILRLHAKVAEAAIMVSAAVSRGLPTRLGLISDLADRLLGSRPSLIAADEPPRGIVHRLYPP
jgi:hypothetical protein